MMGSNSHGQLGIQQAGLPTPVKVGSPSLVESLKPFCVEQVSCGSDFTLAIVRSKDIEVTRNEVYSWGNNSVGQLIQESSVKESFKPMKIDQLDILEEDFVQVSCGHEHVLILTQS
jgi:alpha-tubulin suppressor-like RCC1 family protein